MQKEWLMFPQFYSWSVNIQLKMMKFCKMEQKHPNFSALDVPISMMQIFHFHFTGALNNFQGLRNVKSKQ